jgi:hypothetical protein
VELWIVFCHCFIGLPCPVACATFEPPMMLARVLRPPPTSVARSVTNKDKGWPNIDEGVKQMEMLEVGQTLEWCAFGARSKCRNLIHEMATRSVLPRYALPVQVVSACRVRVNAALRVLLRAFPRWMSNKSKTFIPFLMMLMRIQSRLMNKLCLSRPVGPPKV